MYQSIYRKLHICLWQLVRSDVETCGVQPGIEAGKSGGFDVPTPRLVLALMPALLTLASLACADTRRAAATPPATARIGDRSAGGRTPLRAGAAAPTSDLRSAIQLEWADGPARQRCPALAEVIRAARALEDRKALCAALTVDDPEVVVVAHEVGIASAYRRAAAGKAGYFETLSLTGLPPEDLGKRVGWGTVALAVGKDSIEMVSNFRIYYSSDDTFFEYDLGDTGVRSVSVDRRSAAAAEIEERISRLRDSAKRRGTVVEEPHEMWDGTEYFFSSVSLARQGSTYGSGSSDSAGVEKKMLDELMSLFSSVASEGRYGVGSQ